MALDPGAAERFGHTRDSPLGGITIARGRFTRGDNRTSKRLRINDRIRKSPVRLVDENDEQQGVVNLEEAQQRAQTAQLDLVEVAPQSTPPVCRIMDYGKWMYQQKKKDHRNRANAHKSELKGIRLRPKIDIHDLTIKVEKAREFLIEGHKVQFTMLFRGREMAHRELGFKVMERVRDTLEPQSKVESMPRMMGRRMNMVLAPDKTGPKPKPKAKAAPAEPETPPAPANDDPASTAPVQAELPPA